MGWWGTRQLILSSSRKKWPAARILVLGRAQRILEDHLYDEAIEGPYKPRILLDTLGRLQSDRRSERSSSIAAGHEAPETSSRTSVLHLVLPAESDPAKTLAGADLHPAPAWDMPAGERHDTSADSAMQGWHVCLSLKRQWNGPILGRDDGKGGKRPAVVTTYLTGQVAWSARRVSVRGMPSA